MIQSSSLESFKNLILKNQDKINNGGALVPIIDEHLADLDTPVSTYSKLLNNPLIKNSFIFESADNTSQNSRYSFIGFNPFLIFKMQDSSCDITITDTNFSWLNTKNQQKPLVALADLLKKVQIIIPEDVPRLISGAVGYLGYDSIRHVEKIPFNVEKDQNIPQGILGFYNQLIIFDNLKKTLKYVYAAYITPETNIEEAFKKGCKEQNHIKQIVQNSHPAAPFIPSQKRITWKSNTTFSQFEKTVLKAKEYIAAGDIFQVVLSQRFLTEYNDDPFKLYRTLRIINPSPYLYYINFEGLKIIGSSPELLIRIDEGNIYTRPIAGTRPRGKNAKEDLALENDLLQDKKELAEHLMLVDLGRNDLGRVCKYGSVKVTRMMKVEYFSHVMHIVSDIMGEHDTSKNQLEVLYSAFPAGTLSGAPKIRAMEIIDELEPTERAVYGGTIGYFDFGGNMDWCIAIRTIVLNGNQLTIQAGAGIVADSVPETEYQESINKAQALKKAVEWT